MKKFCRPEILCIGLMDLIKEFPKDAVVAEIGSYAGESAEIFLDSGKVKKIYCIDPWRNGYNDSDLLSYNTPMDEIESIFDERLKRFNNVQKMKMTGDEAAKLFLNEYFDAVYIDANHTYEACKNDILTYFSKIKINGILAGHDYYGNVKNAVDDIFGHPDKNFLDTSWMLRVKSTYKFLVSRYPKT